MSRLVICAGEFENNVPLLEPDGLKRPYTIVTMEELWWEIAAELDIPRLFFKDKLKMMRFCMGHHLICVTTRDKNANTTAMAASFHAMDAVNMRVYPN